LLIREINKVLGINPSWATDIQAILEQKTQ